MKYALLIYDDERFWTAGEDQQKQILSDYDTFTEEVIKAGKLCAAEPLHPVETASTTRIRDGKTFHIDGPFAETKEQLAGFYLLDCEDLDEAIDFAGKLPSAKFGCIEVRPVREMG